MLNGLYITIGGALLALLVAALIAPFVVDWSSYKSNFESEASRIIGQKVTVHGDADASILPMPSLTFNKVVVGEDMMEIEQFSARVELLPLFSGELRVVEMVLKAPRMDVTFDEQGQLAWTNRQSSGELDPKSVTLEQVQIEGGEITVNDARHDRAFVFKDINAAVQARSLFGPFKFDGSARLDEQTFAINLATGEAQADGRIRLKGDVLPAAWPVALAADGFLSLTETGLQYEGQFNGQRVLDQAEEGGSTDAPFSINGSFQVTSEKFQMPDLSMSYGPPDKTHTFGGALSLNFDDQPSFDAILSARQIDLDRSLGGGSENPALLADVLPLAQSSLQALTDLPLPGRLQLSVPSVVLGGGIIQQFQVRTLIDKDGIDVDLAEAAFPGRSDFRANGRLSVSDGVSFQGKAALESDRPSAFAAWLRADNSLRARLGRFVMNGDLQASAAGISVNDMTVGLRSSVGRGSVALSFGSESTPAGLGLVLDADSLNVDALRSMWTLFSSGQDSTGISLDDKIALDIRAQELDARSARFENVELKAEMAGGNLDALQLRFGQAASGRIEIAGNISNFAAVPDGSLQLTVEAEQTASFRELLRAFIQDGVAAPILSRIEQRIGLFAPLRLTGDLTARAGDGASDVALTVSGTASESKFDLSITGNGRVDQLRNAEIAFGLKSENPQSYELLGQLGSAVLPVEGTGAAALSVSATGVLEQGLDLISAAKIAGVDFAAAGLLEIDEEFAFKPTLELTAQSGDVTELLLLKGVAVPGAGLAVPLDVAGSFSRDGEQVEFKDITGKSDETSFGGNLSFSLSETTSATGQLAFNAIDLPWILALGLGPDALESAPGAANPWSANSFAAPTFGDSAVDLDIVAEQITLPVFGAASKASMTLTYRPGALSLSKLQAEAGAGSITSDITLANDNGEVQFTGRMVLESIELEPLVWSDGERPLANGRLSGTLEAKGRGRTMTGLISSLSGGGALQVRDGRVRRLNPGAFSSVIQAADQGVELDEERVRELFTAFLESGSLDYSQAEGVIVIQDGEIRANNVQLDAAIARTSGDLRVDLNNWTLRSNWSIEVDPDSDNASVSTPEVGVIFEGSITQPQRRLDLRSLMNFLTVRSIERTVEQAEALHVTIFENEKLDRELQLVEVFKVRREKRRIAEEVRLKAEEDARRKAEEERRRQEEARLAAEAAEAAAAAERQRIADEARRAEEEAEQARLEEEARLAAEAAERAQKAEEARQLAAEQKALEERQAAAAAQAAEEARLAEEQRQIEAARKLAEEAISRQSQEDEIGKLINTLPTPKPANPQSRENALESLRRQLEQKRISGPDVLEFQILDDPALRPTQGTDN